MSQEAFKINAWIGMVFFRFCHRYHITEVADRTAVLRELVRRKKAGYTRDIKPLLAGKKILIIKPQGDNSNA